MNAPLTIILTGAFVAASCSLVGTFLVLRKMALLGDAISHAVLPGIVIAFLVTNSLASFPALVGASVVGIATVFLVEALHRSRRLYEDTSIGVVFPALFSLGVILVSMYAGQVHIDTDCVLYGEIGLSNLDEWIVGGKSLGPRSIWVTGGVMLFDLLFVLCFYKELKLVSFDPDLAASIGYSPILVHYLLMTAVSITVVASFESVGSILVVAMLVVPPAAAYLLSTQLMNMILIAIAIAVASSAAGYGFARSVDCSIAGAMAVSAGLFFLAAFLASPRNGLVAQIVSRWRLRERLTRQLLLLHLKARVSVEEARTLQPDDLVVRFGWSRSRIDRAVRRLRANGLIESSGGRLWLTQAGKAALDREGTAVLAHP